jgi:hypothetical protein
MRTNPAGLYARGMATEYYFNLKTNQVEALEGKSPAKDVLGPYATREEAERALEHARARTEQWDEEDREWDEGDGD